MDFRGKLNFCIDLAVISWISLCGNSHPLTTENSFIRGVAVALVMPNTVVAKSAGT